MRSQISPLVTVSWLKETIATKPANFQVLDASWHVPAFKRDAPKEFAKRHIPTAQFFQINTYSAKLPTQEQFGEDIGKLGVGNDTHVIVYDNNANFGMFSAPRAWWLLRYFGHENVSILDGGFPKWEEAGYETTTDVDKVEPKTFKATPNTDLLKTIDDIDANIEKKQFTLVDQRSAGRFLGTAPEPRPDIKPGHIKGSVSIPFTLLIDPNTKQMKSADAIGDVFRNAFVDLEDTPIVATCGADIKPGRIKGSVNIPIYLLIDPNTKQMKCVDAIREVFKDASIDLDNTHVVATCGCGVTACFPILGAYICGKQTVPLYDGSWSEFFVKGKPENKIIPGDN